MKSSTQSKHSSKSIVNYESHSILHDKTKILSTHSSKYGSLKVIQNLMNQLIVLRTYACVNWNFNYINKSNASVIF